MSILGAYISIVCPHILPPVATTMKSSVARGKAGVPLDGTGLSWGSRGAEPFASSREQSYEQHLPLRMIVEPAFLRGHLSPDSYSQFVVYRQGWCRSAESRRTVTTRSSSMKFATSAGQRATFQLIEGLDLCPVGV